MKSTILNGADIDNTQNNNVELSANLVAAYVSHNPVSIADLPGLISSVHNTLQALGKQGAAFAARMDAQKPAVAIKKSISDDYIICLEDGKKFKSLKRHLSSHYNMTPEEYREKWGLAHDYPMVAPNYAKHRSELAKQIGLGRKPTNTQDKKVA